VRDLFAQVKEVAPAIVFIDEIDAVGRRREGEGMTGGEREQTVNQLLVEMDGFETTAGIVVIGATNRPDILDPALLRPGRFDRHVTLEAPDIHGRQDILRLHAKGKPLAGDVDFETLARRTPGFTGADLANVINEAALLALREKEGTKVQMTHLTEAVQRVLHGPQRKGKLVTTEERHRLAYHETAHALVASALGQAAEGARISILPRGRGLGQAMMGDESERVLLTVSQLRSQLAVTMAGIQAEITWFGESSTTAELDIERATEIARQMVGRFGMSAEIGMVRLLARSDGYLGSDGAGLELSSGRTLQSFDDQVKSFIEEARNQATEILRANRGLVEEMAGILEEQETLEGPALARLLERLPDKPAPPAQV
ncbi:MAG: AAA family ATPase, partial [Actinomycetota bacterium]